MASTGTLRNLAIRTVSALAAVGILAVIYLFFELAGIIAMTMFMEVIVIKEGLGLIDFDPMEIRFKRFFGILIYLLFLLVLFIEPYRFQVLVGFITLALALSIQVPTKGNLQGLQNIQSRGVLLLIYLGVFPALLIDLLFKYNGAFWFLSLLVMVFAGDVGAYSFGKLFGKTSLLPSLSPKKTWAGAWGGFLATLLSAASLHYFGHLKIPLVGWLVMAGLISFVAQSGDFFESLLKRISDVKDSGNIMPGHGGILDRIDGLIFAAPVMSIALTYFDPWI